MLSHVTIGVADVERARVFYDPIFAALGWVPRFAEDRWAGWQPPREDRPLFILTRPFDDGRASAGNGQMIALAAASRALVNRCYALAIALGGADEGAPGLRVQYHPAFYGAYFRDLDGNKLCVCCHSAE